jgi:hypothetical protein
MGKIVEPKPGSPVNPASRMLHNKAVPVQFPVEQLFAMDIVSNKPKFACADFSLFKGNLHNPSALDLEIQYRSLYAAIIWMKQSSTGCLLQAALAFNQLMILCFNANQPDKAITIASTLLDIYNEIEKRTKQPYQYKIIETTLYKAVDKRLLSVFPLSEVPKWRMIVKNPKAIKKGKISTRSQDEANEVQGTSLTEEQYQSSMPELEKVLDNIEKDRPRYYLYGSPLVSQVKRELSKYTVETLIKQILEQRKAEGKSDSIFEKDAQIMIQRYGTYKLIEVTDLIMYHSVYSVTLDKKGDPVEIMYNQRICKSAESPILYPSNDIPLDLKRSFPPDQAIYISMAQMAGWGFRIQDSKIQQTLGQMIGGFYFSENAQTAEYPYQNELQAWLKHNSSIVIAAVTSPTALQRKELTMDAFLETLPVLLVASIPFVIEKIKKKITSPELLQQLAGIAKEVIIDELKGLIAGKVKNYLVKKLGAKIVPLLNLASTVSDVVSGAEERKQTRIIIACLRMAIQGGSDDDMTISANIMGDVITDKFSDAIIEKLTAVVKKKAGELIRPENKTGETETGSTTVDHSQPTDLADQKSASQQPNKAQPNIKTGSKPPPTPSGQKPDPYAEALKVFRDTPKPEDPRSTTDKAVTEESKKPDNSQTANKIAAKNDQEKQDQETTAKEQETKKLTADGSVLKRTKSPEKKTNSPNNPAIKEDDENHLDNDADDIAASRRELENRGDHSNGIEESDLDKRKALHIRTSTVHIHRGDSDVLRENMVKAGRENPGVGNEAHHIIPDGEPEAAEIRKILKEKNVGINEEANGAYLPRGKAKNQTAAVKHEHTFGERKKRHHEGHPEYFEMLKQVITKHDTAASIRKKLRIIGGFLEQGVYPDQEDVLEQYEKETN